jgi:hypothetical protein
MKPIALALALLGATPAAADIYHLGDDLTLTRVSFGYLLTDGLSGHFSVSSIIIRDTVPPNTVSGGLGLSYVTQIFACTDTATDCNGHWGNQIGTAEATVAYDHAGNINTFRNINFTTQIDASFSHLVWAIDRMCATVCEGSIIGPTVSWSADPVAAVPLPPSWLQGGRKTPGPWSLARDCLPGLQMTRSIGSSFIAGSSSSTTTAT